MHHWEYMTINRDSLTTAVELEACLNRHGEMGWELVSIDRGVVVMKRPAASC